MVHLKKRISGEREREGLLEKGSDNEMVTPFTSLSPSSGFAIPGAFL